MRVQGEITAVTWIPSEAVTGLVYKVPFSVGVAHYDNPPPDTLTDVDGLIAADACRFANRLQAWAEVEDGRITSYGQSGHGLIGATTLRVGRQAMTFAAVSLPDRQAAERLDDTSVRFVQTTGGRTGVPAPRRVSHPPYVQIAAPIAWTTLTLILHADGSCVASLEGASPFPRHWVYDAEGQLLSKTALVDYQSWFTRAFGRHTPWGDVDSPAVVTEVETALEREVSAQIMTAGQRPQIRRLDAGAVLTEQGQQGDELYVLLDGLLRVDVDGEPVAEVGPGAVLGERALLEGGRRTSTLRALTRCTVAVAARAAIDEATLRAIAEGHRREQS
ncbi:MAG: cyclic nucleotide-binding domain-containing protein [Nocardioidaceae bacterium]